MAATAAGNGALHIPIVTHDDLLKFHALHFLPHQPANITVATTENVIVQDEDHLGYYADGGKRTLTDAQIAIFRHSEIHSLLRKNARQREEAEDIEGLSQEQTGTDADSLTQNAMTPTAVAMAENNDEDVAKPKKKMKKKNRRSRPKHDRRSKVDGEWTSRRVAREQDLIEQEIGDLDYG